jgi:transcriptional regulator with XRE-family HTH domain
MRPAPAPRGVEGDDYPRIGRQTPPGGLPDRRGLPDRGGLTERGGLPDHGGLTERGGLPEPGDPGYDDEPTDELGVIPGPGEPDRAARTARQLNGALAGAELADRLKQAWVTAGRPPMAEIGDLVGYSKATISKVLSGKMPPAWRLVRKLAGALGVSATTVSEAWHPLWIAADNYRRAVPFSGPPVIDSQPHGWPCESCGAWVVNTHLHASWHSRWEPGPPPMPVNNSLDWASLRDSLPRREEQAHREEQARRQRKAELEE